MEMLLTIAASVVHFLKIQLINSSLLFCLLAPLAYLIQKRWPLIAIGLWWIIIIRLLLPIDLASPISIRAMLESFNTTTITLNEATHLMGQTPTATNPKTQTSDEPPLPWISLSLFLIWQIGAIFFFVKLFIKRQYFKNLIQRSPQIKNPQLIQACAVWRAKFGIKRAVTIRHSDHYARPFTIGIINPVIFIPKHLIKANNEINLTAIIAHEMAHIKRFDDLSILIQNIILSIYFFHPLLWLCNKQIFNLKEPLCDQLAIESQLISAQEYCTQTVEILKALSEAEQEIYIAAFGPKSISQLKDRFYYLKRTKTMTKPYRVLSTCLVLLLALVSLPMAAVQGDDKAPTQYIQTNPEQKYSSPVRHGRVSSPFGKRVKPAGKDKGKIRIHRGIDIANAEGTPVYPIAVGVVKEAGYKHGWGNRVVIEHAPNVKAIYSQLKDLGVNGGETVDADYLLGSMAGKAFNTTGPHLHLELLVNNEHVDPSEMIDLSTLLKK